MRRKESALPSTTIIAMIRIDYIILKGDWELKKVEKWTEQKDGVCLSDHYPICAELI